MTPSGIPLIDTVLVANRGEIAVRVIRTARDHGYRTVAVYSDADADAAHVRAADTAVRLGPPPARESYLDIEAVVSAARRSGAQAVHPGYGFLSENAPFAEACAAAGLVFVGPGPEAIRLMGDKGAAKRRLARAGVPLLPGYQDADQSDARLVAEAERIGVPVMVKAAAGGGGKGMRRVDELAALPDALAAARREAASAFGSDELILERALTRPRHVEIQVLADTHGHAIALGERDCSIQRRHQKVIEEAPSPALDPTTRAAMQQAAVAAAKEIGYRGAGTVEFLLDEDGSFAFLEMNTRLQVEHPVTEMITGLDLVDWQLRIARGERLTIDQEDVSLQGHAIEARLYAEDPDNQYLPQTGVLEVWDAPEGAGVRVDSGVAQGGAVTAFYDPMLAKIIAHGRDREEARRRLVDALERLVALGVTTNRAFLRAVLRHPVFAAGEATTAFLDEHDLGLPALEHRDLAAVAGWLHHDRQQHAARRSPTLEGWTNAPWLAVRQRLESQGTTTDVRLSPVPGQVGTYRVEVSGSRFEVRTEGDRVVVDGDAWDIAAHAVGPDRVLARLPHRDLDVRDTLLAPPQPEVITGAGMLVAPMHASVTSVPVSPGDPVAAGDTVVVLEAMKMEHTLVADVGGVLAEVAALGDQVRDGQLVARIDPEGSETASAEE